MEGVAAPGRGAGNPLYGRRTRCYRAVNVMFAWYRRQLPVGKGGCCSAVTPEFIEMRGDCLDQYHTRVCKSEDLADEKPLVVTFGG